MQGRLNHEGDNMADTKEKAKAPKTAKKAEEPIVKAEPESTPDEVTLAKAGKRSAKALEEVAEKAAKEERKTSSELPAAKPKPVIKPTRSRVERRGKHFRKNAQKIEAGKSYSLEDAVKIAKDTSHVKFDATVEIHLRLGVDPKHADQNIRDNVVLPAGTGKTVRIAVLTDDVAAAKKAGADLAGTDDIFAALDKGVIDFDVLIATPALMPKLGKHARVLGPRGLMPNPKSGTVTTDVVKAINDSKGGRVEYRVDSTGIVHLGIGKVSFSDPQLLENTQAVINSVKANKPQNIKGNYFKSIYLTTSMGPSVAVDLTSLN